MIWLYVLLGFVLLIAATIVLGRYIGRRLEDEEEIADLIAKLKQQRDDEEYELHNRRYTQSVPLRESRYQGNVNTPPTTPKPAHKPRPQGRLSSSSVPPFVPANHDDERRRGAGSDDGDY